MARSFRALYDLVFPPRCGLCDGASPDPGRVCDRCLAGLRKVPARRLDGPRPSFSAGLYDGVLREGVHRFKFSGSERLARPLAAFLAERVPADFPIPRGAALVAVPGGPERVAARGYDPAVRLAHEVAPRLGLRSVTDLLERRPGFAAQFGLPRPERLANLVDAFHRRDHARARGGPVVVLDDVETTGTTLARACQALESGGRFRVAATLTLAFTPRYHDVA